MTKTYKNIIVALVIVAAFVTTISLALSQQKKYKTELDNMYQCAYYNCLDSLNNIELKISKLDISEGPENQKRLLQDVSANAAFCEASMAMLSTSGGENTVIVNFLNKLSDYCGYLANTASETTLAEKSRELLNKLLPIISELKNKLSAFLNNMDGIKLLYDKQGLEILQNSFKEFHTSDIEYPEMIYDGPFSDGLNDREVKFLKEKPEITLAQAIEKLKSYVGDVTDIKLQSEIKSGIASYLFSYMDKGKSAYAEISKQGGYLIMLNYYSLVADSKIDEAAAQKAGHDFLNKIGYDNMELVWVSNSSSIIYLNFAYKDAGTILYPDLVKLKVSSEDGAILGVEAKNFIYNHTKRSYPEPKAIDLARDKVSKKLDIKTSRITLIPTEWNTEVLAYEFSGEYNKKTYYVYINAVTLKEEKVMIVIEKDGQLIV